MSGYGDPATVVKNNQDLLGLINEQEDSGGKYNPLHIHVAVYMSAVISSLQSCFHLRPETKTCYNVTNCFRSN